MASLANPTIVRKALPSLNSTECWLSHRAGTGSFLLRARWRGRRHEFDPVPLADCRHLGQVVRNRADLAIYISEKRGRMSGHSKNEHSRRRRRRSLKGMHSVARQVSETARFDAHRLPVYLEVERALDHIISLVPVVPMRRWAEADRNLLLH